MSEKERGVAITAFASLGCGSDTAQRREPASTRTALADAVDAAELERAAVDGERAARDAAQEQAPQPVSAEAAGGGADPARPVPAQTSDVGDDVPARDAAAEEAAAAAAVAAAAASAAATSTAAEAKRERDEWWKISGLPLVSRGDAMLLAKDGHGVARLTRQTAPEDADGVCSAMQKWLNNAQSMFVDENYRQQRFTSTCKQLVQAIGTAVKEGKAAPASRAAGAAPARAPAGDGQRTAARAAVAPRPAAGASESDDEGRIDQVGAPRAAGAAAGRAGGQAPAGRNARGAAANRRAEAGGRGASPRAAEMSRGGRKRKPSARAVLAYDEDDEDDAAKLAAERAADAARAPLCLPEGGKRSRQPTRHFDE